MVVLDLGALGHNIPQSEEYLDHVLAGLQQGVATGDALRATRQSYINATGNVGLAAARQLVRESLQQRLQFAFHLVDELPGLAAEIGGHVLDPALQIAELAFAAEESHARGFDFGLGVCGRKRGAENGYGKPQRHGDTENSNGENSRRQRHAGRMG